jgi:hypothetical protein
MVRLGVTLRTFITSFFDEIIRLQRLASTLRASDHSQLIEVNLEAVPLVSRVHQSRPLQRIHHEFSSSHRWCSHVLGSCWPDDESHLVIPPFHGTTCIASGFLDLPIGPIEVVRIKVVRR